MLKIPTGSLFLCAATAAAFLLASCQTPAPSQAEPEGSFLAVAAALTAGTQTLKSVHSGKCLEITDGSLANGAKVQQMACNGSARQQWKLRNVSGDVWEFTSLPSGKCADVTGVSSANGALIQQWTCAGTNNQRWRVADLGSGQFEFRSLHSNRCIDVSAWSTADGAKLVQWDCHKGNNQRFTAALLTPPIPPTTPSTCKRGIAYGGHSAEDLTALSKGVSWWYNWSPKPDAGAAGVYKSLNVEFTPMVWGSGDFITRAEATDFTGAKYLLAFNEPNFAAQANLTAQQAAALWPRIEAIAAKYNLKIVSPATNFCGGACNNTNPYNWLKDFFAACPACKVDYVGSHWYACDGPALNFNLNSLKQFNKPIWLTEFSCLDGADKGPAAQSKYMTAALDILEKDPAVFRYAWFTGRWPGEPGISLLGASGQLTALGTQYVSAPQACKQ